MNRLTNVNIHRCMPLFALIFPRSVPTYVGTDREDVSFAIRTQTVPRLWE